MLEELKNWKKKYNETKTISYNTNSRVNLRPQFSSAVPNEGMPNGDEAFGKMSQDSLAFTQEN